MRRRPGTRRGGAPVAGGASERGAGLSLLVEYYPDRLQLEDAEDISSLSATIELSQAQLAWVDEYGITVRNTVAMTLGNHTKHAAYATVSDAR